MSVDSASQGRVQLGSITVGLLEQIGAELSDEQLAAYRAHESAVNDVVLEAVIAQAVELEAKLRKPADAKRDKSKLKQNRARELAAEGKSPARIAQVMSAEGHIRSSLDGQPARENAVRSVKRWLKGPKKAGPI